MSKHTPGPWYFLPDRNGRLQVGPSINYTVAEMCATPLEGQEANASLIAAAPELLELTELLFYWVAAILEGANIDPENTVIEATRKATGEKCEIKLIDTLNAVRAAIAKATGETP